MYTYAALADEDFNGPYPNPYIMSGRSLEEYPNEGGHLQKVNNESLHTSH